MSEPRICTHAQAYDMDLAPTLTALLNTAFAEYEGAMPMSVDSLRWYLQRPVMDPALCQIALDGETAVSNVFVTAQTLHFDARPVKCGIIDSVCTLPQYRGRGVARKLMERAHEALISAGFDMAVLYTNPDDTPYTFYQRLGYRTRAWADMLTGQRPPSLSPEDSAGLFTRPATEADYPAIRALMQDAGRAYDGMPLLDDAYWRWHKLDRPAQAPALLIVAGDESGLVGTATFCEADLALSKDSTPVAVLADFFVADSAPEDTDTALLAASPRETIAAFSDMFDPLYSTFIAHGFQRQVCEVPMLLPFTDAAREAISAEPGPWYVMVESVVGV